MANFTPTQGRYLAYIQAYTNLNGIPPAEMDIARALCVSPPSVNLMVKTLEKKGFLLRHLGQPRSLKVLVPEDELPTWNNSHKVQGSVRSQPASVVPHSPPANLYVLSIWLMSGPVSEKMANKRISRTIEIRGDQTLNDLHEAIFEAYDREEEHLYQFQFGKKPYDPKGPNYGIDESPDERDARTTKLDDLGLKKDRVFGYWFDFGDDWFHQVEVEKIEPAIPTVTYPRITKRKGPSPPQYMAE